MATTTITGLVAELKGLHEAFINRGDVWSYDVPGLIGESITVIDELKSKVIDELTTCEYMLYEPKENGYDVDGVYYDCTCGADYIDVEAAEEWRYCPYCGKSIVSKETYACVSCKYTESCDDGLYCTNVNGKYVNENVDDANFDGCKVYKRTED